MTNDTSTTGAISCTLANNCGGLVGLLILNGTETVAISGSSATSNVGGIGELGGLIGITTQTSGASTLNISSSYATGNINATGGHDGGLIGEIDNNTGTFLLTQSHASGSVTTTTNAAGGVVGEVNISGSAPSTTISRSYAAGAVNVKDSSNGSSGFIGNVDMAASSAAFTISDSYSTGPVTGNPAGYVAGMIGNMYDGSIISAGVYYCTVNLTRVYTTSVIAGGSGTSGRIYTGETNCTVNVTDSYWEKDVSVNAGIPDDGYQETAAWLQTQTNYPVGYDFTNIWTMSPGPFPSLR
jgi:hypothetical protein